MIGDPPRVVSRALSRGWTSQRIARAYPVTVPEVREWRWRARVVSPDAVRAAEASGVPVRAIAARIAAGDRMHAAAVATGADWSAVRHAMYAGAWDYPPQRRGYPQPSAWAAACRRAADRLRRRLAEEMAQAGLRTEEIAEIVGRTARTVRYWRAET